MKAIFLILILLAMPHLSFSQSGKERNAKLQSDESVPSQLQIVDLPLTKRGFKPKLTLQQALKNAEHYIAIQKIDLSSYYLLEARFFLYGDNVKDPRWSLVWLSSGGARKMLYGVDFKLTVSMDGKVNIIPSM